MHRQTPTQAKDIANEGSLEARNQSRKARMVSYRAGSFEEAENWDLRFWQKQGPEGRLAALHAMHDDLSKVETARGQGRKLDATQPRRLPS